MKIKQAYDKTWVRFFIHLVVILIITTWLFNETTNIEEYHPISTYYKPIELNESRYYDITQNYTAIKLDRIENIILQMIEHIKYNQICFVDEGTEIKWGPISDGGLIVGITYRDQKYNVTDGTELGQKCLSLIDKKNITWNWYFRSPNLFTDSFVRVKQFQPMVISPKVSTNLKINNLYYLCIYLLDFFYVGIFLWAWSRIVELLKYDFRK